MYYAQYVLRLKQSNDNISDTIMNLKIEDKMLFCTVPANSNIEI